jgi:hypothetical protein
MAAIPKPRVLVTGSRDWTDHHTVTHNLTYILRIMGPLTLVHGACPTGADAIAAEWADIHRESGVVPDPHPADWGTYGPSAGPLRNAHMVSLGATLCLAFIGPCTKPFCRREQPHGSHGASGCAKLAEDAGITVETFIGK